MDDGAPFVWRRSNGKLSGIVRPTVSFRNAKGDRVPPRRRPSDDRFQNQNARRHRLPGRKPPLGARRLRQSAARRSLHHSFDLNTYAFCRHRPAANPYWAGAHRLSQLGPLSNRYLDPHAPFV